MPRNFRDGLGMLTGATTYRRGGIIERPTVRVSAEDLERSRAVNPPAPSAGAVRTPFASLSIKTQGCAWNLQQRTETHITLVHPRDGLVTILAEEYKETEAVTDVKPGKPVTIGKVLQTLEPRRKALAEAGLHADSIRTVHWRDGKMISR